MNTYAEVFSPGEFLREELEERNWTQNDLAKIMGKSERLVSEVVNAKRAVTPETAKALAAAIGTSPQYWMNLESAWQLFQLSHDDGDIPRRAYLYAKFPVSEVIRRGWVEDSESITVLEARFCDFFGIQTIGDEPRYAATFRRNDDLDEATLNLQVAWLYRCRQLAKTLNVPKFSTAKLKACLAELRSLLADPENIRLVPRLLSESGIRFVVVEAFKGSKTDGVCFWLDSSSPVIAVSMRYGRIDWFWFTLLHELRHVYHRDGVDSPLDVDVDLVNRTPRNDVEKRADQEAADFLIPQDVVDNFVARVAPLYSTQRVVGFSRTNDIHPGILVGRLQHMKQIPYSQFRSKLIDIRKLLLPSSVADGWGYAISDPGD